MEKELNKEFSEQMYNKLLLRRDRYSEGGWKSLDLKRLLWLLEGELMELKHFHESKDEGNALVAAATISEKRTAIRDNAIDIANYAMMIYEHSK